MKIKFIFSTVMLLIFFSIGLAQNYWEPIFSSQEYIYCLVINSTGTLLAGTENGIQRSSDNGESWECCGLEEFSISCLEVNSNGDIFAGAAGYDNIYRSIDDGLTWTPQNPNNGMVYSLTITSNDKILAGVGQDFRFISSTDNGISWDTFPSGGRVNSVVENSEGILFSGTGDGPNQNGGVYRSYNQGNSWIHIGLDDEWIHTLAINSNDDLFAGSLGEYNVNVGSVFRSTNNGESWLELRDDLLVTSVAVDAEDKIYIGCCSFSGYNSIIYISDDNGLTWNDLQSGIYAFNSDIVEIIISDDNYAYAICSGSYSNNIYRSIQPTTKYENELAPTMNKVSLSNYPNPFNPITTISYTLSKDSNVEISVFNINGQKVKTLIIETQRAGNRSVEWSGRDDYNNHVASGLYLLKLSVNSKAIETKKCLLLK